MKSTVNTFDMVSVMMVKNAVSQSVSGYDLRSKWVVTLVLLCCNTQTTQKHLDGITQRVYGE